MEVEVAPAGAELTPVGTEVISVEEAPAGMEVACEGAEVAPACVAATAAHIVERARQLNHVESRGVAQHYSVVCQLIRYG